jgi:hypothetical protein
MGPADTGLRRSTAEPASTRFRLGLVRIVTERDRAVVVLADDQLGGRAASVVTNSVPLATPSWCPLIRREIGPKAADAALLLVA